ncbi:MAG TPA: methyltransferase domain-containing protein [Ktedonobacteraceae bacterium]|nr:methyltransferase domain-containing protein [Ktedonobacteraceae bacterium]
MEFRDVATPISILEQAEHYQFTHALQGLLPSKLKAQTLKNVLDLHCRTGRWALDFAQTYPQANVTGLDQMPEVIALARKSAATGNLSRVQFYTAKLSEPLLLANSTFDHVHCFGFRYSLSPRHWQPLLGECKRVMRPGASIHLLSFMPGLTSSRAFQRLWQLTDELTTLINYDFIKGLKHSSPGVYFCSLLHEVGFVNVEYELFPLDMGGVEDPRNRSCCQLFYNDLLITRSMFIKFQLVSESEFDELLDQYQQDYFSADFCGGGALISAYALKKK